MKRSETIGDVTELDTTARRISGLTFRELVQDIVASVKDRPDYRPTIMPFSPTRKGREEVVRLADAIDAELERLGLPTRAWRGSQPGVSK